MVHELEMSYLKTEYNRDIELSGKGSRRCFIVGSEGKTALNSVYLAKSRFMILYGKNLILGITTLL